MKLRAPILIAFAIAMLLWFLAGPLLDIMNAQSYVPANSAAVVSTSVRVTIPTTTAPLVQLPVASSSESVRVRITSYLTRLRETIGQLVP